MALSEGKVDMPDILWDVFIRKPNAILISKLIFPNKKKRKGKLWKIHFTVNSLIEDGLVFKFWTFGAVLYLSFCQFLLNKTPNFTVFFSLLFETVFYSKQSSIKDFTVYELRLFYMLWWKKLEQNSLFLNLLRSVCF